MSLCTTFQRSLSRSIHAKVPRSPSALSALPNLRCARRISQSMRCAKDSRHSPKAKKKITNIPPAKAFRETAPPLKEPRELGNVDLESLSKEEIKQEQRIQKRIEQNRKQLLGPGVFAISAVVGIYLTFAYLDEPSTNQASRIPIPQSWLLTPTVIKEGITAGWKELDKLTIGLIVLNVGIQLMRRSPLPFWEKLPHIAGERNYTLLTYPFVHSSWYHVSSTVFLLTWLMPSVVRHFDGDYYHSAAFYLSVPVLTGFLTHLQFKFGKVSGMPLEMGASGALAALIGVFGTAYPHEKVWIPPLGPFRVEASILVWVTVAVELYRFWGIRGAAVSLISHGTHVFGIAIGAAYVYFDGKRNAWEPLTQYLSKYKTRPEEKEVTSGTVPSAQGSASKR